MFEKTEFLKTFQVYGNAVNVNTTVGKAELKSQLQKKLYHSSLIAYCNVRKNIAHL